MASASRPASGKRRLPAETAAPGSWLDLGQYQTFEKELGIEASLFSDLSQEDLEVLACLVGLMAMFPRPDRVIPPSGASAYG